MEHILFLYVLVVGTFALCNARCSYFESGLSEEDKRIVVDKHNELRRLISEGKVPGQPKGVNLKEMKYDETLAVSAQQLTDSCIFDHTDVSDDRWPFVGQNLYMWSSTGFSKAAKWASPVQSWFNEHNQYTYGGPITDANAHYTQVVWADSEYIGCGYTSFKSYDRYRYKKMYACNYGPGGNYIGAKPYATNGTKTEETFRDWLF